MSISSRSELGTLIAVRARLWCLAAGSLAASVLPAISAQASPISAEPAFRVGNEERGALLPVRGPKKKTYDGPGRGSRGGGQKPSGTHATSDHCYVAAGTEWTVLKVFDNDSMHHKSEVSWTTTYGDAELTDSEPWGFKYYPNSAYPTDEIFYQISWRDPPESSETTVTVELGTDHQEGCY